MAIIFGFLAIGLSQELGLISGGKDPMRVLVWGVPAAFVVAGATLAQWIWRPFISRPAVLLGDASYALYLFHQPLILILAGFGYGRTSWPIVIAICIIASISIHFLIERPIVGWFRSKASERNPAILTPRVGAPARAAQFIPRSSDRAIAGGSPNIASAVLIIFSCRAIVLSS